MRAPTSRYELSPVGTICLEGMSPASLLKSHFGRQSYNRSAALLVSFNSQSDGSVGFSGVSAPRNIGISSAGMRTVRRWLEPTVVERSYGRGSDGNGCSTSNIVR